jgi:hypothetical protein
MRTRITIIPGMMATASSRPGIRRRITRDTDAQRAGQHAIHPRVGSQDDTSRLQALTQLGLQVAGDRDHDRGRVAPCQVIDQLELPFWSQRGLQDDHLVAVPGAASGLRGTDRLERNSEPPGSRSEALREEEFILDEEERAGHGCRIPPDREGQSFSQRQKGLGACYNRARESWVEGYGSLRRNL